MEKQFYQVKSILTTYAYRGFGCNYFLFLCHQLAENLMVLVGQLARWIAY